jgi:hypothetical protein
VLAGPSVAPLLAADKSQPFGGAAPPGRQMEERPFGGPPPNLRKPKRYSKKCKTKQGTCALKKEELLGGKCACPGRDAPQGTIVE